MSLADDLLVPPVDRRPGDSARPPDLGDGRARTVDASRDTDVVVPDGGPADRSAARDRGLVLETGGPTA
ncbi:hypothetical protein [Streptomyces hydrogenans]|uniref:hypothetical protein n=1 Tax=Streptomyces hydrogenans TaxID=1873719 RepID=UPI0033AD8DCF